MIVLTITYIISYFNINTIFKVKNNKKLITTYPIKNV